AVSGDLRRRCGSGGQPGEAAADAQSHAVERSAAVYQYSGRAGRFRLARFGGGTDDSGSGAGGVPGIYGAPRQIGKGERVTQSVTRGVKTTLGGTLCARVRPRMSVTTDKTITMPTELTPDKLRWRCELSRVPFETTAQAQKREGFVGQERALRALKMGVELSAP